MAVHDFSSQRLFVDVSLAVDAVVVCDGPQANYLLNVLRLREGDAINVFNGQDGEWRAVVREVRKRTCELTLATCLRPQTDGPDVDYLFAPLKHARLDYMVQKATEMGVRRLRPVLTRRTIAGRVNLDRMRANVIEAAEQCGILRIPEITAPVKFEAMMAAWDQSRTLIFCDEEAEGDPVAALATLTARQPFGVLIGPEGGFDAAERASLLDKPWVRAISLGPRVMRADTAAVAALTLANAVCGKNW